MCRQSTAPPPAHGFQRAGSLIGTPAEQETAGGSTGSPATARYLSSTSTSSLQAVSPASRSVRVRGLSPISLIYHNELAVGAYDDPSTMSFLSTLVKPLAYVSLPVFALHTLSKLSPIARYYIRLALYLSTPGVCSTWGVVCAVGMSLVGRKFDMFKFFVVVRTFHMIASRVLDIRLAAGFEDVRAGYERASAGEV
ncbi:hypothetical protein EVJ58_g8602 [Rhodofomes roseus]|uniref:Uncharacterized protein n=1 Tax=Rhodofomes roseus TaxID=34475 RepID=A0A4Y9XYV8_9APHY|nr:hypothetical protein EVJ58_g8602 [Rhodofomes roseus]